MSKHLLTKYLRLNVLFILLATVLCYFVLEYQTEKILVHEVDEEMLLILEKINAQVRLNHQLPANNPISNHNVILSAGTFSLNFSPGFETSMQYVEHKKGFRPFRRLNLQLQLQNKTYNYTIEKQVEGTRLLKKNLTFICLFIFSALILGLLFINRVVLKNLWKPFYETLSQVRDFKLNKDAEQLNLPPSCIVEFDDMNEVLSEAVNKARKDYQTLKEFTQSASHELQTPLAVIRSKLDLLLQQNELSADNQKLLASIYSSIQRLADLNRSLLLLARMDNDQFDRFENIDLKIKLLEKIEQFQEWISDSKITLDLQLESAKLFIHAHLSDILLNNLISNAIRHNFANGSISVETTSNTFSITNTGAAEALQIDKIFLLFYKNGKENEGAGLGLSIVKKIVTLADVEINYVFTAPNLHQFKLAW